MPKLVYTDPESNQEVTVELNEEFPEITIGRNPGNEVRVNNPSISRQHARVSFENGQCTLLDLDSSNGSYINGNRIRSQVLVDGDRIRVGEFPVDYMAQLDEATYEVDQQVISELQREMQVPANGDVRRQTAIGGFEAEPPGDAWGAEPPQSEQPTNSPHDAFAFVDDDPYDDGPVSLSMDLIEEVSDSQEFVVDEDAILEELPAAGGQFGSPGPPPVSFGHDDLGLDDLGADDFGFDDPSDNSLSPASAASALPGGAFSDLSDFGEVGAHNEFAPTMTGSEPSDATVDTYNAAPEEIAHGLRALDQLADQEFTHDATVEHEAMAAAAEVMSLSPAGGIPVIPADAVPARPAHPAPPVEAEAEAEANEELAHDGDAEVDVETRFAELLRERDELLELLDSRAGDAEGASQVQIERLRKERDRLIEERRNLKRQIGDLQRQAQDAPSSDELESTLAQLNESNDRLTVLEVQVEDLKTELAGTLDDVENLQTEREMLQAQLADAQSTAQEGASLNERLSDAEEVVATSQHELQEARVRVASLEAELATSHGEVQQLVDDLEARTTLVAELEVALADSTGGVQERDTALETMNQEIESARVTIAELEAHVERVETELEARPVADDLSKMQQDLSTARASVEALTEERDELVARRDKLEKELHEARQLYDTLEARHAEIGGQLDEVTLERDALKHEKGAFAREADYLQVEKRKLDSEVRQLRKEVQSLSKSDKRKKQVFEELSSDLKKLVAENNELQRMVEDLDRQLSGAPSTDDLAAAQRRAQELDAEVSELRQTVAELEGDTGVMTRELGSIGEERDRLNEQLTSLRGELQHTNETLEALRASASEGEDASARVVQLEVQVENLNHDIEQARAEADEARLQAQQAAQAASKAEAEAESAVSKSQKEFEKLKKKLADAENTLAKIILEKDRLEDEIKSKG